MINTVIRNLLSNAVKFTGINGKIFISCSQKNGYVEICIRDTGFGMEQEDIQNLFTIDDNLIHEGTAGEKGTGLGLLICKEFVKNHSGRIWAESEIDKGSSFFFTIPNQK
jgi:signal transduction histidine kinase